MVHEQSGDPDQYAMEQVRLRTRVACARWIANDALPHLDDARQSLLELMPTLSRRPEHATLVRETDALTAATARLRTLSGQLATLDDRRIVSSDADNLVSGVVRCCRDAEAVILCCVQALDAVRVSNTSDQRAK